MDRNEIVISVQGGIVQEVFCPDADVDVIVVDWDCQGGDPQAVEFPSRQGLSHAAVGHILPQPLHVLAGSDIEAAIDASEGYDAPISAC